jgi:hypothetical protein
MKARYVLAALAATWCVGASAQNMKPGLWEVTNNVKSSGGEMEKGLAQARQEMANMPAEQRKMMEEAMAKQGVKLGAAGPGGISARMCMTREMAERNEVAPPRGDCKTTRQQRTGNTMKVAFTCTNPPSSGDGQITFVSPEAYTMKMTVNSTVAGKAETMNMDASGKWLSADCGSVKPMGPAAKK